MRFAPTEEQRGLARVLDDLLREADTPQVVRSWARGEHDAGLKLWRRLADIGVPGLLVEGHRGGVDGDEVDLVVAFEELGRHAVPGPWVESAALLPRLLGHAGAAEGAAEHLSTVAAGEALGTVAVTDLSPLALDADVSTPFLLDGTLIRAGRAGAPRRSLDPARRLFPVTGGEELARLEAPTAERALDTAALACGAQLLGLGERLLAEAVGYARQRRQFGRAIGEFQALKHALADVRVALDFARPLLYVAALSLREGAAEAPRDVSAAKVAVSDAALLAARSALQVHGAVGYTAEHHLGLWVLKVRALAAAWGTPAQHRARVLAAITASSGRSEA